jgi:O-antigen ligase
MHVYLAIASAVILGFLILTFLRTYIGRRFQLPSFLTLALLLSWVAIFAPGFFGEARINSVLKASQNPVNASNMLQAASLGLAALISLGLILKSKRYRTIYKNYFKYYLIYSIIALASAFWSILPLYTFAKAMMTIFMSVVVLCMILYILSQKNDIFNVAERLWNFLAVAIFAFLFILAFDALINPEGAFTYVPSPVLPWRMHKGSHFYWSANIITQYGAIGAIIAISRLLSNSRRLVWWLLLLLALSIMVVSQSRTSIIAFVIALPLVLLSRLTMRRLGLMLLALCMGIIIVATEVDVLSSYLMRGQSEEQFIGMTGRANYWQNALSMAEKRPLLGYGYWAGTRVLVARTFDIAKSNADNTYLEVFVDLGLLGLVPFMLFIIILGRKFIRYFRLYKHLHFFRESAAVYVIIVVRGVANPTFHQYSETLLIMGFFAAFLYAIQRTN